MIMTNNMKIKCVGRFSNISSCWLDRKKPISAVNASHFLPCELQNKIRRSFAK